MTDWSVDPEDWGYFLSKTFDEWRRNDLGKVLVNHFETLVSQHIGRGSQLCIYGEFCGKGLAIEHDGGVYSCDHYVYPEYRLGNIQDSALDAQAFSRTQVKFGYAKNETLPELLPPMPVSHRLLGRMPEEPHHPHAGWRAGPELPLPRPEDNTSRTPCPRWSALWRICRSNPFNHGGGCEWEGKVISDQ